MSTDVIPAATDHPDQQLHRLGGLAAAVAAINAATGLGVLDLLDAVPANAEEVARQCATAHEPTRLLLDALTALGMLHRDTDRRYSTTPGARWYAALTAGWSHLDQVVRTGQPIVPADTPAGAAQIYPDTVAVLGQLFAPATRRAAQLLPPSNGQILDVGAGAAPWSIALALANPTATVTALDVPDVLRTTHDAVDAAGVATQFAFLPGDMFTIELREAAYDTIILGNICHLFDPDTNQTLLHRLRPALRPGGTLVIIDAIPSQDPGEQRHLRLYELGLRLRTSAGRVHAWDAYAAWANAAGYSGPTKTPLSSTPPLVLLTWTAPPDQPAGDVFPPRCAEPT